jgi:phosphopantothenoylcysteine decarboxylase/phosphopantothenate--cysteine ligase
MTQLKNKRILVIVAGGIAAYKSLELVRRLRDADAAVRVVMTQAAQQFVGQLSFQALSGQIVRSDLLDPGAEAAMGHIELARWADAVVIAPATADILARVCAGLADDLATTICLATTAPLLIAPAMNQQMWQNAATQRNIATLLERGAVSVGPDAGAQACGEIGPGRLAETESILTAINQLFTLPTLSGVRIMITAGPTQEAIDPVRFIGNRSSGKMGFALAQAARDSGADVHLVHGPVAISPPTGVRAEPVVSAEEMYAAVISQIDAVDIFIGCAAVADYRIEEPVKQKRKKSEQTLNLTLTPTRDILRSVTQRPSPPFAVGFAAETENLLEHAQSKLKKKSLDMIAANIVGVEGSGFESSDNELHVLWNGGQKLLAKAPKEIIANQLVGLIATCFGQRPS